MSREAREGRYQVPAELESCAVRRQRAGLRPAYWLWSCLTHCHVTERFLWNESQESLWNRFREEWAPRKGGKVKVVRMLVIEWTQLHFDIL